MTTTTVDWGLDLDDSSSFKGSWLSSSTVPGPGAIAGKLLKTLGERSLDLVVVVIIRRRLAAIERTFEKNPHVLRNPTGDKEWKRMIVAYKDLHELCRESNSAYYPLSLQRAAANLIRDITLITRPEPDTFIDASPTNQKWEELLARVERRRELSSQWQHGPTINADPSRERDSVISSHPRISELLVSLNASRGIDISVKIEEGQSDESHSTGHPRNRMVSTLLDRIFKSWTDRPPLDRTPRTLVLAGQKADKSTLVKQIQASLDSHFPQKAGLYHEVLINNMWQSMKNILSKLRAWQVSSEARFSFELVRNSTHHAHYHADDCVMCNLMWRAIITLWQDPALRRSARQLNLIDSEWFFDSVLPIISKPDFPPMSEGVFHCRAHTTGPYIEDSPRIVIEAGGKQPERTELVNHFEKATAAVFVGSLSGYKTILYENRPVDLMENTLMLFQYMTRSQWFTQAPIISLFTKSYILVDQIEWVPLKKQFPAYTGESLGDALRYLEGRFLSLVEDTEQVMGGSLDPGGVNYGRYFVTIEPEKVLMGGKISVASLLRHLRQCYINTKAVSQI